MRIQTKLNVELINDFVDMDKMERTYNVAASISRVSTHVGQNH